MALIPATQLRVGMLINYQNNLYRIMAVTHVTPGNWRGMVQTKMRSAGSSARKRSYESWSRDFPRTIGSSCLGRSFREKGQRRVPRPPAIITAYSIRSVRWFVDECGNGASPPIGDYSQQCNGKNGSGVLFTNRPRRG